jgi:predicted membrane-bound spermidine synthase
LSKAQLRYLYLTVFTSGLTTLGIELTASRLLGVVFGTSNLVWALIIGWMLIFLTAGYFIGGRWADRLPDKTTFFRVVCWGAFTAGLVPIVARPVLKVAAQAIFNINVAVIVGSIAVILLAFAVPVILLGTVSPFAIRLAIHDTESSGQTAGRMYAVSTVGSIIGTFLPVLVLIPLIGTNFTFLLLAGTLLAIGLIGLWQADRRQALLLLWMPAALGILAAVVLQGPVRPTPPNSTLIYEKESAYNYIQVARVRSANFLFLNEGQGVHSVYFPDAPGALETGGTWDYFLAAPFFNDPPFAPSDVKSMALIGLAGGTIARQYTAVFGPIPIDGAEIDPDIARVGREYFGMTEPNINVIVQDGRLMLDTSPKHYDVIAIDAYRLPYIPWHLTTVEFFQSVRDHLTGRGVLAINVGRTVSDRRLIAAFAETLAQVYPAVYVIDVPNSCNSIMVATVQPTHADSLLVNAGSLPPDVYPLLPKVLGQAYAHLRDAPDEGVVFTDDKAAVELMTDTLLVNFILSGDTQIPCR